MSSALSSAHWADEEPAVGAPMRRRGPSVEWRLPPREPVRVGRVIARFLMTFCFGVAATLAWQSYGDAAREMIARASPQLAWLAPAPSVAQSDAAALSHGEEELKAISFGLAGVRLRVDQIAAQLAASQEQMTGDITNKLNAAEQDILDKISAPPPQPTAAAARKPASPPPPVR